MHSSRYFVHFRSCSFLAPMLRPFSLSLPSKTSHRLGDVRADRHPPVRCCSGPSNGLMLSAVLRQLAVYSLMFFRHLHLSYCRDVVGRKQATLSSTFAIDHDRTASSKEGEAKNCPALEESQRNRNVLQWRHTTRSGRKFPISHSQSLLRCCCDSG